MTMRLEPESLGSMRVQMTMTSDRISLQFHTQTSEAGTMIRESLESLRQSLESQGFKLDSVSFQPLTRTGHSAMTGQQSQQESGDKPSHDSGADSDQRHDAADERSRGHHDEDTSARDQEHESGVDTNSRRTVARTFESTLSRAAEAPDGP